MKQSFLQKINAPVDGASLAFLRISYGLIMAVDIVRLYFKGILEDYYFKPTVEFTYFFAPWVKHFPDQIMLALYWIALPLALCFMVGYRFKITGLIFLIIQSYFFLTNPLNYLNHIYFAILVGFLLWIGPSNKLWSLDSIRNRKNGSWLRNDSVPKWAVYIIIIQMEIMLIWAGLVKLSPEFLEGHSLREWFNYIHEYPFFTYEWQIRVGVFIGIATHLFMAPFLLFKKTRLYAFIGYGFFHLSNHILIPGIGIFPILTFAATTIFLSPSWPRIFFGFARKLTFKIQRKTPKNKPWPLQQDISNKNYTSKKMGKALIVVLSIWLFFQLFLPVRHFLIPGNVHWDRNGNLLAWQMMLISRRFGEGGGFYICGENIDDKTFCRRDVLQDSYLKLNAYIQLYMYPDLAIQYAHQLKEKFEEHGYKNVRVYGVVRASISGRPFQNYWDPNIDLTQLKRSFWKDDFLLPMKYDRPDLPPIDANLNGKLKSEYNYWQEKNQNKGVQLYDVFHQMYPAEIVQYEIERRRERAKNK